VAEAKVYRFESAATDSLTDGVERSEVRDSWSFEK
jgi:hypothetical protein